MKICARHFWLAAASILIPLTLYSESLSENLLLNIPFEKNAIAAGPGASMTPAIVGKMEFAPMSNGNGIVRGYAGSSLIYPVKNIFPKSEGSISFWTQILWDPASDTHFHHFIRLQETSRILIYRTPKSSKITVQVLGEGMAEGRFKLLNAEIGDWKPGTARHLGITWSDGMVELYIDGSKAIDFTESEFKSPNFGVHSKLFIGDHYHQGFGVQENQSEENDTIISDVRLYGTIISQEKIQEIIKLRPF